MGVTAQSREKFSIGASVNPTATYGINTSSSDAPIKSWTTLTYKQFADSVRSFERVKFSLGATVWGNYLLNAQWSVQAGLGYSEVGFVREQNNIHLGDSMFPGVGRGVLEELSNTTKNIEYRFRYQYLTVPVLFNYYVKRSRDFKWTYSFTGGIAMNVLIKHQIKAVLDNFYIDNLNEYKIDSTGYEGHRVTMNVFLGGKFEYKMKDGLSAFGQPMITIFPFSVSQTEMKCRPIGVQFNIGLSYDFTGGGGSGSDE